MTMNNYFIQGDFDVAFEKHCQRAFGLSSTSIVSNKSKILVNCLTEATTLPATHTVIIESLSISMPLRHNANRLRVVLSSLEAKFWNNELNVES